MDKLISLLRASGEPTRLRILALCAAGDLTVSDLTRILGQSQPGISRHLKQLCDAGLLERYQEGSWAFFHLPSVGEAAHIGRFLVDSIPADDSLVARDRVAFEEIKAERAARAETYFRDNAESWDRIRALHVDEAHLERAILETLSDTPVESLLDIGTGTGRMLQLLADRAGSALGIDQSRDMLAVARTHLSDPRFRHCSVRKADMYDLPFDRANFDLVMLHMVLHFADRPAGVLREAARVLKPGGHCLIVDFERHDLEELRTEYAHRRLGFRSMDIEQWAGSEGLEGVDFRALPGERLTVNIWKLRRSADVHRLAPVAGQREVV